MLMSMICAPRSTLWRAASTIICGCEPAICTAIGHFPLMIGPSLCLGAAVE